MVQHIGTQKIRTQRLLLRRFSAQDLDDYFAWTGSAEASRFILERPFRSREEAGRELARIIASYDAPDYYMWGIELEGELVGFCCGNEINEQIDSVCLGYGLKQQYWNRGIATEAAGAMIDYFFHIGFNRVFSYHNPLNPASGKVMQKCGMAFEGRIRGGSRLGGRICDCLQYSILRDDRRNGGRAPEEQENR